MSKQFEFDEGIRLNNFNCIKELLDDSEVNPSQNNFNLQYSIEHGHFEISKLLIKNKRIDASMFNNYAMNIALKKTEEKSDLKNEYQEIINLLIQDYKVIIYMKKNQPELYNKFKTDRLEKNINNF
jgi:hypothetical protein